MNTPPKSLAWHIKCTHCEFERSVRALVPYNANNQPSTTHEDICGFWEDYICLQHFQAQRVAVHLSDVGLDIETAYLLYFTESSRTQKNPKCPICQQTMQGGQVLQDLPFWLQPLLNIYQWMLAKLAHLQHLYLSEAHSIDQTPKALNKAHQLLLAESDMLKRFHQALCKEFDLDPAIVPFINDMPANLNDWDNFLSQHKIQLEKRLEQIQARQKSEQKKQPACCPACGHESVYLIKASTI